MHNPCDQPRRQAHELLHAAHSINADAKRAQAMIDLAAVHICELETQQASDLLECQRAPKLGHFGAPAK